MTVEVTRHANEWTTTKDLCVAIAHGIAGATIGEYRPDPDYLFPGDHPAWLIRMDKPIKRRFLFWEWVVIKPTVIVHVPKGFYGSAYGEAAIHVNVYDEQHAGAVRSVCGVFRLPEHHLPITIRVHERT